MDFTSMPNPVMQQGQCVTNCTVDTFFTQYRKTRKSHGGKFDDEFVFNKSGDNESFYVVMPREFALRLPLKTDQTIGRSSVMSSSHMAPRIFTSLNNFPVACTKDSNLFQKIKNILSDKHHQIPDKHKRQLRRLLRELICRAVMFVGVPTTRVDPSQNMSSSISVTVSGTITVYNTGDSNIDAGQKVAWDIPDVLDSADLELKIRGEPRGKRFIELVAIPENGLELVNSDRFMDPAGILEALKHLVKHPPDGIKFSWDIVKHSKIYDEFLVYFDGSNYDLREISDRTLQSAIQMTMGIHSRVIGTALTTSSPGASFDILLQI